MTQSVRKSATTRGNPPAHFLRRVAHSIILRAAVRGRIGWPVALAMLGRIDGSEVQA